MARTTDDFEYTHRPSYQNITGAGSTGFEPWKNIGRPMTAPDTWDPFGNFDPFGGGLYRTASQRDPGILADLLGRGGGDTPPLDTGYNINVNVVADLLKGLAGSPDRTPTGQAAVTESPTTQSQLSPEAQAQSQAQNISIIAEMLREAEEVKKRNPQFTNPYAGLEGKIASAVRPDGREDPYVANLAPLLEQLYETKDDSPEQREMYEVLYRGAIEEGLNPSELPPQRFVGPAQPDVTVTAEQEKVPLIKGSLQELPLIEPSIYDAINYGRQYVAPPEKVKSPEELQAEALQAKVAQIGRERPQAKDMPVDTDIPVDTDKQIKSNLEEIRAMLQTGRDAIGDLPISPRQMDTTAGTLEQAQAKLQDFAPRPEAPEKMAALFELFKDPGFQRLAGTGLIAALGGAGRGREAKAFTDIMDAAAERKLKQQELDDKKAAELVKYSTDKENAKAKKIKEMIPLIQEGFDPRTIAKFVGVTDPNIIDQAELLASAVKKKITYVDPQTGETKDVETPGSIPFANPVDASKFSLNIKKFNADELSPKSAFGQLMRDYRLAQKHAVAMADKGVFNHPEFGDQKFIETMSRLAQYRKLISQFNSSAFEKLVDAYLGPLPPNPTAKDIEDRAVTKKNFLFAELNKDVGGKGFSINIDPEGFTSIDYNLTADELEEERKGLLLKNKIKAAVPAAIQMKDSARVLQYGQMLTKLVTRDNYSTVARLKQKASGFFEDVKAIATTLGLDKTFGIVEAPQAAAEVQELIQSAVEQLKQNNLLHETIVPEFDKRSRLGNWEETGRIEHAGESTANSNTWFNPNLSLIDAISIAMAVKMARMAEPGRLTDEDINRQFKIIYGGKDVLKGETPSWMDFQGGLAAAIKDGETTLKEAFVTVKAADPNTTPIPEFLWGYFGKDWKVAYPQKPFWETQTYEEHLVEVAEAKRLKALGKSPLVGKQGTELKYPEGSLANNPLKLHPRSKLEMMMVRQKTPITGVYTAGQIRPIRPDQIEAAVLDGSIYDPTLPDPAEFKQR